MMMRTFDFSPLYRSAIGYDRLANLLDSISNTEQSQPSYPPYNIELTGENEYRISMAIAGFDRSEVDIEVEQNLLTVSGRKQPQEKAQKQFLHQGIAERNFVRKFQLADFVKVVGATLENGLLHVDLAQELPERMKPRKIEISTSDVLEQKSPALEAEQQNGGQTEPVKGSDQAA